MQDIGPQYDQDDAFTARMRFHQSWYRAARLRVEFGTGPQAGNGRTLGSMLRIEDGDRGLNFLRPDIAVLAMARQREFPKGIDRFRLLCNMLSSQPMCFNLFGPLALDRVLAAQLVGALLDEPVRAVERVVIEHAPAPARDYLDDATSFDAYVEYELESGEKGFVGIETKLTEPFSKKAYPLDEHPAYQRCVDLPGVPWKASARKDLDSIGHNQLWRDHMLVFALLRQAPKFARGRLMVIRHPVDKKCAAALDTYSRCIIPDGSLIDRPLDEVVCRWLPLVRGTSNEAWLESFAARYVRLDESESAWKDRRAIAVQ